MNALDLLLPCAEYADQILQYRQEMLSSGSSMDGAHALHKFEDPLLWIEDCALFQDPQTVPEGRVPSSTYLAVRREDHRLVGMIDLRHHIDHPILGLWGGHIGYSVRPSERRKGYATEMLRLCLEKCRERGLKRVLVTCHDGNIGSEKAIRNNGGVYEKSVTVDGAAIKRFWIKL